MFANLHPFIAPTLITMTVITLWRRLLAIVLTLLAVTIAVGTYEILTFIWH
jgi:hypothetical protein